jgi:hypothetical protein
MKPFWIVPPRRGPVSWEVMRLPVRLPAYLAAMVALTLCAGTCANGQVAPAQTTQSQPGGNGTYISVDPLANVRYDNRFDVSVGAAYDHMKAGPTLLQGSNLGGIDVDGSYWIGRHWAVEGSGRYYLGTSGTAPNSANSNGGPIKGAFVSEVFAVGGAEWLGPHNKHGAILAHAMFGGVKGNFQQDLLGQSPQVVAFYNDQFAPAAIVGGHFDLNRSPRWVFRVTPDAVMTHYSINYGPKTSQFDVNFAISVGVEYRFKKKR